MTSARRAADAAACIIVETWGRGALRELVETGGALEALLDVDETRFVSRWLEYLRRRYDF